MSTSHGVGIFKRISSLLLILAFSGSIGFAGTGEQGQTSTESVNTSTTTQGPTEFTKAPTETLPTTFKDVTKTSYNPYMLVLGAGWTGNGNVFALDGNFSVNGPSFWYSSNKDNNGQPGGHYVQGGGAVWHDSSSNTSSNTLNVGTTGVFLHPADQVRNGGLFDAIWGGMTILGHTVGHAVMFGYSPSPIHHAPGIPEILSQNVTTSTKTTSSTSTSTEQKSKTTTTTSEHNFNIITAGGLTVSGNSITLNNSNINQFLSVTEKTIISPVTTRETHYVRPAAVGTITVGPLILDLSGAGQPDVSHHDYLPHTPQMYTDRLALFDLFGTGTPSLIEWVGPDAGILCIPDEKGQINSALQLFGDAGGWSDGYEKLAALYDKNHDGVISGDEMKGLAVWVNKAGDGKVHPGEIVSLESLGIKSISAKQNNYQSWYQLKNGTVRKSWDWWPSAQYLKKTGTELIQRK